MPRSSVDAPDADELLMAQRPGRELHHQVGAAGERPPRARLLREQRERLVERAARRRAKDGRYERMRV